MICKYPVNVGFVGVLALRRIFVTQAARGPGKKHTAE